MVRHFENSKCGIILLLDPPIFLQKVCQKLFETDPQTALRSLLLPPGNKVTKPLPFLQNETSSFVQICSLALAKSINADNGFD